MIKATSRDKEIVVTILAESFDSNKSVNYVANQSKNRLKNIRVLMEYSFDTCLDYGEIFLSEDKSACALILYPENKKTTYKSIYNDLRLAISCIGVTRIFKVLEREGKIKSNHPKTSMAYLWFMGVTPAKQGTGIGGKLLTEVITYCDSLKKPIFLETSTLKNLPWYSKYGFGIIKELDLSYTLYILKRDCSLK